MLELEEEEEEEVNNTQSFRLLCYAKSLENCIEINRKNCFTKSL